MFLYESPFLVLELDLQPGFLDVVQNKRDRSCVPLPRSLATWGGRPLDPYLMAVQPLNAPDDDPLPAQRLGQLEARQSPLKSLILCSGPDSAIQSRGRYFQHVGVGNGILYVKRMPDENVRALAILNRDVIDCSPVGHRPLDHQAKKGVATATTEFNVNEHQPERI
jgi:hypothetical protein